MKRFLTLAFFCLSLVGVYGQMPSTVTEQNIIIIADGTYILEKAELIIRNYNSKEVIEHKIITNAADLDSHNIHLGNIFLEVEMKDAAIEEYTLSDGQRYKIVDMMGLQPALDIKGETQEKIEESTHNYAFIGRELSPYDLLPQGEKLIVTFVKYTFGQSDVSYTMEAELVVTMTKQKDK